MRTSSQSKGKTSLIYRHIWLYRVMMNVLYGLGYKSRFLPVIQSIERLKPKSILELCFGDTLIASYCSLQHIPWQGIDSNDYFVRRAIKKGLLAQCEDLRGPSTLPTAGLIIMVGSLYHFHECINQLLSKMLNASSRIIISEPVINFSNQKNWVGWIARRATNAGQGEEGFRYTMDTLVLMLTEQGTSLGFTFEIIGQYKKDCILLIEKVQS